MSTRFAGVTTGIPEPETAGSPQPAKTVARTGFFGQMARENRPEGYISDILQIYYNIYNIL